MAYGALLVVKPMSNPSPQLDSCRRRGPRGQARPARHVAVVQASRRFRATLLLAASVCAALALALAGCGGSSKSTGGGTAASHAPGAGATSSTGLSGDSAGKG